MDVAAMPAAGSAPVLANASSPQQNGGGGHRPKCCNHSHHHHNTPMMVAGSLPLPAGAAVPPVPDEVKAALGLPTMAELQRMDPQELKRLKGALQQRLAQQLQMRGQGLVHGNGNGHGPPPAALMAAAAATTATAAAGAVGANGGGVVELAPNGVGSSSTSNGVTSRTALHAVGNGTSNGSAPQEEEKEEKQLPPSQPTPASEGQEAAPGEESGGVSMDIFEAVKLGLASVARRIVQEQETKLGGEPLSAFLRRRDADGHTVMHWAAKRGDFALVKFLASKGAPLFEPSEDSVGMEPVHWAITEGHLPVLHFLVSKGADINARDKQLCTPLLIAAQYGQAAAAAYLIQSGADTALLDVNRDSACHWAAYKGELAIVQLLHHLGLPPDDVDGYGQTPLHLAALRGNLPVVEYLVLDADAQTSRKDKNGATPLDLAVKKGQRKVAAFLRSHALERFHWRQLLSLQHWRVWLLEGGGNAEASAWPFYLVIVSNLWCHLLFPLRFFSEAGVTALASHGALTTWCVALQLSMWLFFLLAWKTDPGHITSQTPGARAAYDAALARFTGKGVEEALLCTGEEEGEAVEEGNGGGLLKQLTKAQQLCHACRVVRPPRSKHCRVCRRCCAVMDHHCPFLGNCVGAGNYRWFLAYVVNTLLAIALFVAVSCIYLRHAGADLLVLLTLAFLGGMGLMVGMLACYHGQLVSANLTTNEHQNFYRYEYFKDANGRLRNPYDEGCARNCMSRLMYAEAPPVVASGAGRGAGGVGRRQRRGGGEGIFSSSSLRPVVEDREEEEEEGLLTVV